MSPRANQAVRLRQAEPPFALAVDVGTSSSRVTVFDRRVRPIAGTTKRTAHALITDDEGAAVLRPDPIVAGVASCVDGALNRLGRRSRDVAVVGTSTFWHGVMGVDRNARPTTPLFTWADLRAREAARVLAQEIDADAFHARTGCYFHSTYPVVKLRWIRDSDNAVFRRTARWISLAEYLDLRFTGQMSVSHGIASATGLYNQNTRDWDRPTIAATGARAESLSPISDEPHVGLRPTFARRWPALARVPWVPALGDGALANVGSGCAVAGRVALSLGTSGAARVCYRGAAVTAPSGLWAYRLDERYVVVGGAISNGGNAVDWAERTLGKRVAQGDALTVLPLFMGERTPWWDDGASAAIAGLRLATRPAEIAGALFEAVALRLAAAARALIDSRGGRRPQLIASGGAFARRPELVQIIADALGSPIGLTRDTEASTRGAAIVALERIGVLGSIELAPAVGRTFRPRRAMRERYERMLERQARLHLALREAGL